MTDPNLLNVTQLLTEWRQGNHEAFVKLQKAIHGEMRQIAHAKLKKEENRPGFQTTDLLHETYVSLLGNQKGTWESRKHFYCAAAKVMKHILIDAARKRLAEKRGSGATHLSFNEECDLGNTQPEEILALNDALTQLKTFDQLGYHLVELRFFGGYTIEDTAQYLNIPVIKANRKWAFVKTWLYKHLEENT